MTVIIVSGHGFPVACVSVEKREKELLFFFIYYYYYWVELETMCNHATKVHQLFLKSLRETQKYNLFKRPAKVVKKII